MTSSEDPEQEPKPGLSFELPFLRGSQGKRQSVTWDIPWSRRRPQDTVEDFPRLEEPSVPSGNRIATAWGWAPLATLGLLFTAFVSAPVEASTSEQDDTGDAILGLAILALGLLWYTGGTIAAFKGIRRGLTWTLPLTVILAVLALSVSAGDASGGGNGTASAALAILAVVLHFGATRLSKT